mgnify:CR=1 FL=1
MIRFFKRAAAAARWTVDVIRSHPWLLRIASKQAPEIVKEIEEDILEIRHFGN